MRCRKGPVNQTRDNVIGFDGVGVCERLTADVTVSCCSSYLSSGFPVGIVVKA